LIEEDVGLFSFDLEVEFTEKSGAVHKTRAVFDQNGTTICAAVLVLLLTNEKETSLISYRNRVCDDAFE
jgi:hypothetical protein